MATVRRRKRLRNYKASGAKRGAAWRRKTLEVSRWRRNARNHGRNPDGAPPFRAFPWQRSARLARIEALKLDYFAPTSDRDRRRPAGLELAQAYRRLAATWLDLEIQPQLMSARGIDVSQEIRRILAGEGGTQDHVTAELLNVRGRSGRGHLRARAIRRAKKSRAATSWSRRHPQHRRHQLSLGTRVLKFGEIEQPDDHPSAGAAPHPIRRAQVQHQSDFSFIAVAIVS